MSSLVLAIIESRSNDNENGILEGIEESEIEAPLIKIQKDEDAITPPNAE